MSRSEKLFVCFVIALAGLSFGLWMGSIMAGSAFAGALLAICMTIDWSLA